MKTEDIVATNALEGVVLDPAFLNHLDSLSADDMLAALESLKEEYGAGSL